MKTVKDLKPGDRIVFADDEQNTVRRVEKLVETKKCSGWIFVYLEGDVVPELLNKELPLDPQESSIYLA